MKTTVLVLLGAMMWLTGCAWLRPPENAGAPGQVPAAPTETTPTSHPMPGLP